jgi:hypothetical protein
MVEANNGEQIIKFDVREINNKKYLIVESTNRYHVLDQEQVIQLARSDNALPIVLWGAVETGFIKEEVLGSIFYADLTSELIRITHKLSQGYDFKITEGDKKRLIQRINILKVKIGAKDVIPEQDGYIQNTEEE